MAELLAADRWVKPDSLAAYLRHALPDDYLVVASPIICRCPVAAVVVGRSGLFVVHPLDDEAAPADPAAARRQACAALEAFLADEFPGLHPQIHEIKTARDWAGQTPTWIAVGGVPMRDTDLGKAIEALDGPPLDGAAAGQSWADADTRETLAVALRDRQLTVSERAKKPFVFRSGGFLRTGTRAWTICDAARHMDRHPADGMHHLRDGTLAAWLDEEGAPHLAQLARDVVNQPRIELRVALEKFLVGAGLAARPALRAAPRSLDLGYVVQGGGAARLLRLRRGRGRGYLFGELRTNEPWLSVEPDTFQGGPAEIVVAANTAGLPISPEPEYAEVLVASNASEAPVAVPASVRVVALPSRASLILLRPLAGLLAAAPLGALIGALWPGAGVAAAAWLAGLGLPGGPYVLPLALIWALAGLVRGARQPAAWPVHYALLRWLARAAGWSAGLALLAAAIVFAWQQGLGGGLDLPGLTAAAAAAVAAAAGFFPATLDELANSRHEATPGYVRGRRSRRRTALLWAACIVLLLVALLTPRLAAPLAGRLEAGAALEPARGWITERWDDLNSAVDRLLDRAILRYYDRAAPTVTPAPTLQPTP